VEAPFSARGRFSLFRFLLSFCSGLFCERLAHGFLVFFSGVGFLLHLFSFFRLLFLGSSFFFPSLFFFLLGFPLPLRAGPSLLEFFRRTGFFSETGTRSVLLSSFFPSFFFAFPPGLFFFFFAPPFFFHPFASETSLVPSGLFFLPEFFTWNFVVCSWSFLRPLPHPELNIRPLPFFFLLRVFFLLRHGGPFS